MFRSQMELDLSERHNRKLAEPAQLLDEREFVRGGEDHFEVIAIYTVKDGQIARVDFAK